MTFSPFLSDGSVSPAQHLRMAFPSDAPLVGQFVSPVARDSSPPGRDGSPRFHTAQLGDGGSGSARAFARRIRGRAAPIASRQRLLGVSQRSHAVFQPGIAVSHVADAVLQLVIAVSRID
jgi:hypothetical protein